jgi:hypothetical protein
MADVAVPPAPPPRVARLPQDRQGRPVPWFVAWIDGVPDFRIVAQGKVAEAVRFHRCFICGEALGRWLSFAVGPLCTINRTAPEPPAHKDCAIYAAQACPFLTRPGMRRRGAGLPPGLAVSSHAPGATLAHNPGVTAIWTTRRQDPFADGKGGLLMRMGDPDEVLWFAEGRPATRADVQESLESELAILRAVTEQAGAEAPPGEDLAALEAAYREALRHLPAGP